MHCQTSTPSRSCRALAWRVRSTVGTGAQLISSNSLTVVVGTASKFNPGVQISAQQALPKSAEIDLGTSNYSLAGLVLDQAALTDLAGVKALTLQSASTINLYGTLNLGQTDPATGQPVNNSLTFDSAGLVEMGTSGTATFTAGQVIFENTLGSGTVPTLPPVAGTTLAVNAIDVLGPKTGFSNAQITLGTGAVTLTGFGAVDLRSTGQIVATGNGGSLTVESPLTLDAPRIGAGTLGTDANGVTKLNTVAYAITAVDNPANPGTYYPITFTNSSGTTPPLSPALLGSSLTVTGSSVTINTDVALPGGTFTANAGGNIVVGPQGVIDVSGQAVEFVDVLATIGGGAINLTSASGGISIQAGAVLNVGDLADAGALNQTSAGTLTLSAPTGGVTVAPGTLQGQGMTAIRPALLRLIRMRSALRRRRPTTPSRRRWWRAASTRAGTSALAPAISL